MPADVLESPAPAPARSHEHPEGRNYHPALLIAVVATSAVLRVYDVSSKSFWFDEAVSAEIAKLPWSQFFLVLWKREANMALYYGLLHFWIHIGSTVWIIRFFSVLISVATVPILFLLGERLFGRKAGLLAAWLLAINAYHICYGQEARAYALVVFLATLATLLFVRNVQDPASARWGSYAAVCALAVYSHFFGGLMVIAHGVSLFYLKRKEAPWRDFLRGVFWFAALVVPVAIFVFKTGAGPINWIQTVNLESISGFLAAFAGNGGWKLVLLDAFAGILAMIGAWKLWHKEGRTVEGWGYALVAAWFLAPIVIVLAASPVLPLFVPRYLSPCLPALILIVADGVTRLRPTALAWLLGAAISIASLAGTASYYQKDFDVGRNDWPGATSFVFDHAWPGDTAFFYLNFARVPFEFYRSQRRPPSEWPKALVAESSTGLTYRDFMFTNLGESLQSGGAAGDRVWLILMYDTAKDGKPNVASDVTRAVFGKGRQLIESKNFSGITVLLFARSAPHADETNRESHQIPGSAN
jgi:mannosyltransferase